jgi:hypothetical protein
LSCQQLQRGVPKRRTHAIIHDAGSRGAKVVGYICVSLHSDCFGSPSPLDEEVPHKCLDREVRPLPSIQGGSSKGVRSVAHTIQSKRPSIETNDSVCWFLIFLSVFNQLIIVRYRSSTVL